LVYEKYHDDINLIDIDEKLCCGNPIRSVRLKVFQSTLSE